MTFSIIVVGIVCLLLGFLISYLIKTTKIKEKNQEIEKEEIQAQLRIKELEKEYIEKRAVLDKQYNETINQYISDYNEQNLRLEEASNTALSQINAEREAWEQEKAKKILTWSQHESDLKSEVSGLEHQIIEKKRFIDDLDEQAKTAVKLVEEQLIDNMTNNIELQGKELVKKYEKLESELTLHYTNLADDKWDEYQLQSEKLDNDILQQENKLNDLQSKVKAAIETNKRMELDRQQKNYYKLQLDDIDLEEIKRIRSIEPYLRKKEPLNKVIWKVYYEKPYTDLIGRVIGQGRKTGIYKITNIDNGMCYIGQAVDIAERWKQHIKRGIGADPPTQNKLYPTMQAIGVENFTFEIIEECAGNLLNEREDYWQTFYQAKEFGYSIK